MPPNGKSAPSHGEDFVIADAEYFRDRARRCYGLAGRTRDKGAAQTLRSLGDAFKTTAERLTGSSGVERRRFRSL